MTLLLDFFVDYCSTVLRCHPESLWSQVIDPVELVDYYVSCDSNVSLAALYSTYFVRMSLLLPSVPVNLSVMLYHSCFRNIRHNFSDFIHSRSSDEPSPPTNTWLVDANFKRSLLFPPNLPFEKLASLIVSQIESTRLVFP